MPKNISPTFSCSNCDAQYTKWVGRCLECGKWGTIIETKKETSKTQHETKNDYAPVKTSGLNDIESKKAERVKTNIEEFDRVLGGGLVRGSLILLGGEPGIGKSTLALQLAAIIPHTIYMSGEESVEQIKLRSERLDIKSNTLQLGNATNIESIIATIKQSSSPLSSRASSEGSTLQHHKNDSADSSHSFGMTVTKVGMTMAIVDSIQTLYSEEVEGEAGNINQVRACTVKLMELAKSSGVIIVLIGQVTKDGSVAGPKTLEHLVDAVLYLEGDKYHQYRILRTAKNRFGSTDEVGVFSMEAHGLQEVKNPSEAFLSGRGEAVPGSTITCLIEGSRPVLVEVQALVTKTNFGFPQRRSSGFDLNRLQVLIGVLSRRAGLPLDSYDVFINVVGGLEAGEPAADLAVVLALASGLKNKTLPQNIASFGEVGLGGEIRPVSQTEKRLNEMKKMGFEFAVVPQIKNMPQISGLKIAPVKNVKELVERIVEK